MHKHMCVYFGCLQNTDLEKGIVKSLKKNVLGITFSFCHVLLSLLANLENQQ